MKICKACKREFNHKLLGFSDKRQTCSNECKHLLLKRPRNHIHKDQCTDPSAIFCSCGCGIKLRKDNTSGWQLGHRPCALCGEIVKYSHTECCSKSCSTALHWQRNPEMRENRVFNADRLAVRELNREQWIANLSDACTGRESWNEGRADLPPSWNAGLPTEMQPGYGKIGTKESKEKRKQTLIERYGVDHAGIFASSHPVSKMEIQLGEQLPSDFIAQGRIGRYKVDFLNPNTKQVIEMFGDYWHCNPTQYAPDYYHSQLDMTAEDKWAYDNQRIQYLKDKGYHVAVIWESDYKKKQSPQ
jgi:hypothetical protein